MEVEEGGSWKELWRQLKKVGGGGYDDGSCSNEGIKEMGQWAFTYLLGHTLNLLMLGYIAHFSPVSLAEIHNTWRFRTQVDI